MDRDKSIQNTSHNYDVFISYSRKDTAFAAKLEKALEDFKPPDLEGIPQRSLKVFRDENELMGADYYRAIENYLGRSEKLIVICSPHAVKSEYVNDEISRFARLKSSDDIIPVIIDGVPNPEAKPGQEDEKAFPASLCEVLELPLAISYREFDVKKDNIHKGSFDGSWYTILASIYGIDRSNLEQRDRKKQLRNQRRRRALVAIVMLALLSLSGWALYQQNTAEKNAREAEKNAREAGYALAHIFEAQSGSIMKKDTVLTEIQKAWLYTLAALGQKIPEDKKLENSQSRVIPQGRVSGIYQQIWASPRPLNNMTSVVFSPDGKRLASASNDRTIRLWDMETGEEIISLTGHLEDVTSLAFSPNGKILASGSKDESVRLWDVETGSLSFGVAMDTLTGHLRDVRSVAFHPQGKLLASASKDGKILLWEVKSGTRLLTLGQHRHDVFTIAFSPDGNILATGERGKKNSKILLWGINETVLSDSTSIQTPDSLSGHLNDIWSVAFSPDGRYIASGSKDSTVILWDAKTHQIKNTLHGHRGDVWSVAFSADSKLLASASGDHTIRLWDVANGSNIDSLIGHTDIVWSVAFNPVDNNRLASCSQDFRIRLWDVGRRRKEIASLTGHTDDINSVAISPDDRLLASASNDRMIRLWDMKTGNLLKKLGGHRGTVLSVAFGPSETKLLASAAKDKTVRIWDVETGEELKILPHRRDVRSVAFSHDGRLIASSSKDKLIRLWNVDATVIPPSISLRDSLAGHRYDVRSVAFSPDDSLLVSGSSGGADSEIMLWNIKTAKLIEKFKGHENDIWSVAFSPDGQYVASGSKDKTIRLWNIKERKTVKILEGDTSDVWSINFSRDGKLLASGSLDHTVRLWLVSTGENLAILNGHTDKVWGVSFSSDSKILASGSSDKSIRLWDVKASCGGDILLGHKTYIKSISYRQDGKYLASGSLDGEVKIWDTETGMATNTLKGHDNPVESVVFNPVNPDQLASASKDGVIHLWDLKNDNNRTFNIQNDIVYCLAFSPGGKYLACGAFSRGIFIWNVSTGDSTNLFMGKGVSVLSLAFSPAGKGTLRLAAVLDDKSIRLIDIIDGRVELKKSLKSRTLSVAFSPDGKVLASGSTDENIILWNVESGEKIATLIGHTGDIKCVAFSPNGKYLASASVDRSIRLWDTKTFVPLDVLSGHHSTVYSIEFDPTGRYLASGSGDKTIRIWYLNHLGSLYNVMDEGQPAFKIMYEAFLYLLPYRFQEFELVKEDRKFYFSPENGYEFPKPRKFQKFEQPRPVGKDPFDWVLEK